VVKRLLIVCALFVGSVCADTFTFDFRGSGGSFDFDAPTGQITTNGITLSFSAYDAEDPLAELNSVSYLGVNSNDDTDTDTVEIGQSISILFTSSIYNSINLQNLGVGAWTSGDAGYYQVNTDSVVSLTSGENAVVPNLAVLGKTLKFASTEGNGLGFNTITVEAVPEPATISMIGVVGLMMLLVRRRGCL
jgi:hypothetical protein